MKLQESMKRFKTKNLNEQAPLYRDDTEMAPIKGKMDMIKDKAIVLAKNDVNDFNPFDVYNPQIGLILDVLGSMPMLTRPATLTKILLGYSKAGIIEDELVRDLVSMIPMGKFIKVGMVIKKLELLNAKAKAEASAEDRK